MPTTLKPAVGAVSPPAGSLATHLISAWLLEEGPTTWIDQMNPANTGAATGTAPTVADQLTTFGGAGYIIPASPPSIAADYTFIARVKFSALTGFRSIYSENSFGFFIHNGKFRAYSIAASAGSIAADTWVTVCARRTADVTDYFIDGVFDSSISGTNGWPFPDGGLGPMGIGGDAANEDCVGIIDYIFIFDAALTDDEIEDITIDPFSMFSVETTFEDATVDVGLTLIHLYTRDGAQRTYSDKPLPDPDGYENGWKAPKVLEWSEIVTACSNVLTGQGEASEFVVTFTDQDHVFRQLDAADLLVGSTCVVKMNTDPKRRALIPWRTRYRGTCVKAEPTGVDKYRMTYRDPVADRFSSRTNVFPDYLLRPNEFATCGVAKVNGSCESYVVDGAGAPGDATVAVRDGWGVFCPGQEFRFSGHDTFYTITLNPNAAWDPETSIAFSPPLTDAVADGETFRLVPSFDITPTINKPGRVRYGYHTDRTIVAGVDAGDGQGPLQYTGDVVLDDGKTYGEFLWAIHACATPTPIEMIYAWNDAIDHAHSAYFYPGVTNPVPQPGLTVEAAVEAAGVGGRIAIPGFGNWTTNVGADTFIDRGTIRFTPVYLRGIYRDWALGALGPPLNVGGVPMAVAAHGCAANGDGSGDEIDNAFEAYLHVLQNWCPAKGGAYRTGDWLTTPLFLDGTPIIDEDSFAQAQTASADWVEGGGFMAVFSLGENDEQLSAVNFIAAANRSFGSQSGINRHTQFAIHLPADLAGVTLQEAVDWVRDIFSGSFAVPPKLEELYTAIDYVHTRDYFRREPTGWRSSLGIDLSTISTLNTHSSTSTIYNDTATIDFGGLDVNDVRRYTRYEMPFVRGRRGTDAANDPPEYVRGDNTIIAVLTFLLARISNVQHLPKFQAGPRTFNFDLGDIVPETHYEGLGTGWVDERVSIERMRINPTTFTGTIEGWRRAPLDGAFAGAGGGLGVSDDVSGSGGEELPVTAPSGSN